MRFWETKFEKGKYVTRILGVRVRKSPEPALSVQASLLRRELLTMADVGNMPPARGMARDVQLAGLVLLREVLRVARANGFHPWTISGSLLGTIRHNGHFIPWDDDVDQGMMREEYARFCEVFNEKCAEGFFAWRRYSRKWNQIKVSHRELPKDVTMSVMSYDRYFRAMPTLAEKHEFFMKVRASRSASPPRSRTSPRTRTTSPRWRTRASACCWRARVPPPTRISRPFSGGWSS